MTKEQIVRELYPEDVYRYADKLTQGEAEVLYEVRQIIEKEIRPVINEYWEKAEFPFEAFYKLADAGIMNSPKLFEGRDDKLKASQIYNAFLYYELASFDTSIATFYTVHGGLGYNTILLGGSEEQIEEFGTKVRNFEWQTCFALTEPDHGSDIAGGLATTAERKGDKWILNGEKRWIGGADSADIVPVFARDVEDGKIKCFIVRKGAPGYKADPVQQKISLRCVQNGHITMENVEVPDVDRLPNINGFKDVARILIHTRADVAHIATGVTGGAYKAALKYTTERDQFDRKVAGFQLVQEKLSRMLANTTTAISFSVRIAELMEAGEYEMFNSSLAKMSNSLRMRETVALARETCGGNGITLETDVARFFADAEAVYTYEGSHEVNALIVGREITGMGAFV
ncbi:acyl-CoA dehydrogenase family protein [Facklamia sp. DSM 111018]|uniref:Acyl-CoA dehydrogenase family protein n=1 Tax=Facklamia lactis TaxID=2749967 RepID=A0ABS0LQ90_9LACT|nr:acyl-CoA dehydrogenase family protein [Facklamia lactis]MBG9980524.1 acyl-CoA dehydrogenase family protein [Facklamia lactis]MBG9986316.1 acyl-CoA dehydrogenase family protein [Facklamia lactis]